MGGPGAQQIAGVQRLLSQARAPLVLLGGAIAAGAEASLMPETLIRFSLLQALSTKNDPPQAASRPFTLSRDGFVMGDGAGALVLETEERARARGASILGYVLGAGEAIGRLGSDADVARLHEAAPALEGWRLVNLRATYADVFRAAE